MKSRCHMAAVCCLDEFYTMGFMLNNSHTTTPSAPEGIAFPELTARDLEQLRPFGIACSYEDGQVIFSAGVDAIDLFVVESGAMEILNPAQDNRSVVTHGP